MWTATKLNNQSSGTAQVECNRFEVPLKLAAYLKRGLTMIVLGLPVCSPVQKNPDAAFLVEGIAIGINKALYWQWLSYEGMSSTCFVVQGRNVKCGIPRGILRGGVSPVKQQMLQVLGKAVLASLFKVKNRGTVFKLGKRRT